MQPGMTIDRYQLIAQLGDPSMGEVWKAQGPDGHLVAIKTLSSSLAGDSQFRERFSYEAQRHTRLRHPNIVPTLAFLEREGRFFLVMEFIPGGSLADRLSNLPRHQMPVPDAVAVSRQVLNALNFVHQQMIIHRDVKPSNVLMNGAQAFVADFGIAIQMGGKRLTTIKRSIGTTEYMSPEQIVSPDKITHLSDVYSFGCVLYEMLAGRPPFVPRQGDSDGIFEIQEQHVKQAPQPIRRLNPDVPERLDRIVQVALSKEPASRFAGCGAFEQALTRFNDPVVIGLEKGPGTDRSIARKIAEAADRQERPAQLESRADMSLPSLLWSLAGLAVLPAVLLLSTHNWFLQFLVIQIVSAGILAPVIYRAWRSIGNAEARKMALLMLIPGWSFYWGYRAIGQYGPAYNRYIEERGLTAARLEGNLFLGMYVAWAALCLVYLVFPPVLLVLALIAVPGMNWFMSTACDRLSGSVTSQPLAVVPALREQSR
jgi:serine/threonine protein kinase